MTAEVPGQVQTVLGPVAAADLGRTLIHEHLVVDLRCYWSPGDDPEISFAPLSIATAGRIRAHPFAARDNLRIDEPHIVAEELRFFADAGGSTVVDVTPDGIGRDPRTLVWMAQRTGVNVIAGCGYYIEASHPPGMSSRSHDDLASEMVRDLTDGIGTTGVRAGVIGELGMTTYPMGDDERKVLEAAAVAQREVGCAIVTHSAPGHESPFEVAGILADAGADMERVVLSHLDERFRTDVEKFRRLADTGVNFGFDTFGRELYYEARKRQHPTDEQRIKALLAVVEAGLIDRVTVAQDICLKHELTAYGGYGYDHVLRTTVPRLRDRGLTEVELDQILVQNPARILAWSG